MKVALLVDQMSVTHWQAEALRRLGDGIEFVSYNCTNAPSAGRRVAHVPYYLLNVLSLRTELTRKVELPGSVRAAPRTDFECEIEGNWQRLPQWLVDKINADRPVAIVKFGLGLLRVPDDLAVPILSYHHGDPREFRGRPAGFYEMLTGQEVVGQVVQVLSNHLDAGRILAFAQTRVHRHSYRATMREAYATSRFLLGQALAAARDGRALDIVPDGTVYRLPSGWRVLRFAAQRVAATARRLAYGAFIEKQWQVAEAPATAAFAPPSPDLPERSEWRDVQRPKGYRFLADPFPLPDGSGMLVEALRASTGLGEILVLRPNGSEKLLGGSRHFSYPAVLRTDEGSWLLPEVAEWSAPRLYSIGKAGVEEVGRLDIVGDCRLVDPTLLQWGGNTFLFGNHLSDGDWILRLWRAASVRSRFEEHPSSPIRISPLGGRMGGAFITANGSLYRVGQNGAGKYGDGVLFFEVDQLSADTYRESLVGSLRFKHCHGPHTINLGAGSVLFDHYRHRFAPLAAVRRLRGRIARH
jgi:hypothetical protein